jgi:uncharacterized membrane protein YedE/YeeE
MYNLITRKSWSPYFVGAAIGVLSWFAFASADKPLGITTAFENTAALVEKAAIPNFEQANDYYAAKAQEGKSPKVDWEWMLVLGVFIGALLSASLSGDRTRETVPEPWRRRFGGSVTRRFAAAFLGGALMMFGARLAQGCTSGHGISGALQLAVSSWVFVVVFFAVATGLALLMYGREEP